MLECPDLSVPKEVMQHVVHVESSRNPFAIGVVGGYLARQPKSLDEALAAVRQLKEEGYNFSVGIAQVNRYNLAKYGLKTYADAFEICPNLQAGSRILRECYDRAQDWGKAFSCYYSGNFVTGYKHGYVQKIFASIQKSQAVAHAPEDIRIIPYSNVPRKQARSDSLPLVAAPSRESQTPEYPEPPSIRQALLNAARSRLEEPVNLRMSTSVDMDTSEVRAAIPVPGPGAVTPGEEKTVPKLPSFGLQHIPTQLVGINGNPYQTKLLVPASSGLPAERLPLPDMNAKLPSLAGSVHKSNKFGATDAMTTRKGGGLLHPMESSGKPESTISGAHSGDASLTSGAPKTAAPDGSFVF